MSDYEIQIALDIFLNDNHPKETVEKYDLSPDKVAVRGERNQKLNVPRKSYISYRSEASQFSSDLEEHWSNLKNRLLPKQNALSEIGLGNNTKFTIIVKPEGRIPGLLIEHDFLQFASSIHACIDVDIYEND